MNKNEQDMIRKIKEKSEQVPVNRDRLKQSLQERRKKCGLRRESVGWQQHAWC